MSVYDSSLKTNIVTYWILISIIIYKKQTVKSFWMSDKKLIIFFFCTTVYFINFAILWFVCFLILNRLDSAIPVAVRILYINILLVCANVLKFITTIYLFLVLMKTLKTVFSTPIRSTYWPQPRYGKRENVSLRAVIERSVNMVGYYQNIYKCINVWVIHNVFLGWCARPRFRKEVSSVRVPVRAYVRKSTARGASRLLQSIGES